MSEFALSRWRSWRQFARSALSILGLLLVITIVAVAIFAPYVAPFPRHAGVFTNFSAARRWPRSPCSYVLTRLRSSPE